MKAGAIRDALVRLGSLVADAVKARREAKRDDRGDEGGHPQKYPLDEARDRIRRERGDDNQKTGPQ